MISFKQFLYEMPWLNNISRNEIELPKAPKGKVIDRTETGHEIWHHNDHDAEDHFYCVKDGKVDVHLHTIPNPEGEHLVLNVESDPKSTYKAKHLYHRLMTKHGHTFVGNDHSIGAAKMWQWLAKQKDVHMKARSPRGKLTKNVKDTSPYYKKGQQDTELVASKRQINEAIKELFKVEHSDFYNKEKIQKISYRNIIGNHSIKTTFHDYGGDVTVEFTVNGKMSPDKASAKEQAGNIYNHIYDVISSYIIYYKPKSISYSAYKPGMNDMYKRLGLRLAAKHNGWYYYDAFHTVIFQKEKLKEEWHSQLKISWRKDKPPTDIFKNPNEKEMREITDKNPSIASFRFITHGNDMYAWNSNEALHADIYHHLYISDENSIYGYVHPKQKLIEMYTTDDKSPKDNPYLKSMHYKRYFSRFSTNYDN